MKQAKTKHVARNKLSHWIGSVIFFAVAYAFFMWYHEVRGKPYGFWTTEKCTAIAATCCIALALALGPLSRFIPPMDKFLPWRRSLGLSGAYLVFIHVVLAIGYLPFWMPEKYPLSWYLQHWATVVFGVTAATLCLYIGWHSYPARLKKLGKRKWMIVQKLAYLLLIVVMIHLLTLGKAPNWIPWFKDPERLPFPPGSFAIFTICISTLLLKIIDLMVHGDSLGRGTKPADAAVKADAEAETP